MKKKIIIILISILLAIVLVAVYWFKRGDVCLTQPPYFNCHTQNKFDDIDAEFNNLSNWLGSMGEPSVFNVDKNEDVFSFEHMDFDGGVGWTRIMKNEEIKDSLGFYTNYIDPILTPLSENTLIGSAWQWPQDSKLYNGPFFNYYLDFRTRKTVKLPTKGRLIAKSQDGQKAVFLESDCDKYPLTPETDRNCNNRDLSLRLINLRDDIEGITINHYYAMNRQEDKSFLDFGKVVFSPDNKKLAIEVKIEEVDYDTPNEYWTLFIADTETGEIIKQNNKLSKNRYEYVFWLDNENIIYW
ncbi:hypothetical protein L6267_04990 [Candidatus Parcubacteria bacterium]|nr:hypothetical protein [Candidatus Parcubacteria bacterium]